MTELQGPEQVLYDLLAQHESLGPKQAADALGWNKEQVAQANRPLCLQASKPKASRPKAQQLRSRSADRPLSLQASKPLSRKAPKPKAQAPSPRLRRTMQAQSR